MITKLLVDGTIPEGPLQFFFLVYRFQEIRWTSIYTYLPVGLRTVK